MPSSIKKLTKKLLPEKVLHTLRIIKHVHLRMGEPELTIIKDFIRDSDITVDVGANVGLYSEVLSHHSEQVLSFEPNPDCSLFLERVLRPNCRVFRMGLSDRLGSATLKTPRSSSETLTALATISPDNDFSNDKRVIDQILEEIRISTLDEILNSPVFANRKVDFIKIDVEGHEWHVLTGAEKTISRFRPIFLVETEFRHNAPVEDIFRFMANHGYLAKALIDNTLTMIDVGLLKKLQASEELQQKLSRPASTRYVNNIFFFPD